MRSGSSSVPSSPPTTSTHLGSGSCVNSKKGCLPWPSKDTSLAKILNSLIPFIISPKTHGILIILWKWWKHGNFGLLSTWTFTQAGRNKLKTVCHLGASNMPCRRLTVLEQSITLADAGTDAGKSQPPHHASTVRRTFRSAKSLLGDSLIFRS